MFLSERFYSTFIFLSIYRQYLIEQFFNCSFIQVFLAEYTTVKNRLHIFHICLFQSSAAEHQLNEHFHFLVCFFYHIRLLDTTNQPLFRSKFLKFLYSGIENLRVTQVILLPFLSNFSTT